MKQQIGLPIEVQCLEEESEGLLANINGRFVELNGDQCFITDGALVRLVDKRNVIIYHAWGEVHPKLITNLVGGRKCQ